MLEDGYNYHPNTIDDEDHHNHDTWNWHADSKQKNKFIHPAKVIHFQDNIHNQDHSHESSKAHGRFPKNKFSKSKSKSQSPTHGLGIFSFIFSIFDDSLDPSSNSDGTFQALNNINKHNNKPWNWRIVLFNGWMMEWNNYATMEPNLFFYFLFENQSYIEIYKLAQPPIASFILFLFCISSLTAIAIFSKWFNAIRYAMFRLVNIHKAFKNTFFTIVKCGYIFGCIFWTLYSIYYPIVRVFIKQEIIPKNFPFDYGWSLGLEYCFFETCKLFIFGCFTMYWIGLTYDSKLLPLDMFSHVQESCFKLSIPSNYIKRMKLSTSNAHRNSIRLSSDNTSTVGKVVATGDNNTGSSNFDTAITISSNENDYEMIPADFPSITDDFGVDTDVVATSVEPTTQPTTTTREPTQSKLPKQGSVSSPRVPLLSYVRSRGSTSVNIQEQDNNYKDGKLVTSGKFSGSPSKFKNSKLINKAKVRKLINKHSQHTQSGGMNRGGRCGWIVICVTRFLKSNQYTNCLLNLYQTIWGMWYYVYFEIILKKIMSILVVIVLSWIFYLIVCEVLILWTIYVLRWMGHTTEFEIIISVELVIATIILVYNGLYCYNFFYIYAKYQNGYPIDKNGAIQKNNDLTSVTVDNHWFKSHKLG